MDFRLSPEDEAFRREVRDFIKKNWDPKGFDGHSINVRSWDFDNPESRANDHEFRRKLVEKGWYTMHWPKEYGGQDASVSRQFVYGEELAYANAPAGQPAANITGALMFHGSDWMKQYFLPRMASGDLEWAQGFSEPNAGTDLANLQTRAVEDGDDFVITGQKIWSSGAHLADWYHVLVRTDPSAPKHRGISYFALQIRGEKGDRPEGLTLRPLYDMMGRWRWCEVFMDGVRVPKQNMIGELNRGWYAAMTTLNFERTGSEGPARHIGILDRFISLMRKTRFNGEPILNDPIVRHKLADIRVILEADRMLAYRVVWMQARGDVPQAEGAISGYRNQVTAKFHFWPVLAKIIQDYGILNQGESRAPYNGYYGANLGLASSIGFGGGGGILLGPNIIAQRGLGLPR
jgi:alkylation response protein AidB-like acyl-CoA dehydrogenase